MTGWTVTLPLPLLGIGAGLILGAVTALGVFTVVDLLLTERSRDHGDECSCSVGCKCAPRVPVGGPR